MYVPLFFSPAQVTNLSVLARNPIETNKIDVHGLRPREAFDRIERAIVKAVDERKTVIRVIVGKGLHSVNQQPTLKPAVQREMQRYVFHQHLIPSTLSQHILTSRLHIPCEVDSRNPGILNITLPTLPSSSGAS